MEGRKGGAQPDLGMHNLGKGEATEGLSYENAFRKRIFLCYMTVVDYNIRVEFSCSLLFSQHVYRFNQYH